MQPLENILEGSGEPKVSMINVCIWQLCAAFNKGQQIPRQIKAPCRVYTAAVRGALPFQLLGVHTECQQPGE